MKTFEPFVRVVSRVNYGTGKDVSDEDVSDAKIPLRIKWRTDSFVTIPIWK